MKNRKIPHAVYVPDDLWRKVQANAKRRKLSASAVMRQLLSTLVEYDDPTRAWVADGQHTPEAEEAERQARAVAKLLEGLS
jgi:hypothetical protein